MNGDLQQPDLVSCTRTLTIVCHDFVDNIDRRVLNFAANQIRLGYLVTILGITREHTSTDTAVTPNLRIIGAPVLEIRYNSPKWMKGAYQISHVSWASLVSYYVLRRRALGMYLERRAPPLRLALLAIRRSFKSALSRVIALAEKFNRPSNEETLTDFERAKVLSQARQLRPEEINHLKRIYKGSIKTIPLGPLTPEEFDPLPFNDLFEVYLDKLATPDLLVACDLPSLPAAVKFKRSRGCKLLYDAHELYPFQKEFTRRQKLYLAQEEAAALRDVDHVITVSDSIVDYFNQIYGVQATCINNAPSFDSPPDAFRDLVKLPQLDGKVTLLYHGGFSKGRQLLELAQAFKTLAIADVAMVYIGAGELKPALQDLAARTPNLYILDAIPQEAIPALLQSVDLITVSYPALDENTRGAFPNKLGDAIQLGVPIIGNSEMQNLTKICTQYEIGHCGKMNDVESIRQTLSDGITWYKSKSKQDLVRQFEQARSDLGWESQIKKFDKVIQSLFQPPADPGTAKKSVYSQMSF